jgi:hypothetical protein
MKKNECGEVSGCLFYTKTSTSQQPNGNGGVEKQSCDYNLGCFKMSKVSQYMEKSIHYGTLPAVNIEQLFFKKEQMSSSSSSSSSLSTKADDVHNKFQTVFDQIRKKSEDLFKSFSNDLKQQTDNFDKTFRFTEIKNLSSHYLIR